MAQAICVGGVKAQVTVGHPVAHQRNDRGYNCGSVSITTGSPARLEVEVLVVHRWMVTTHRVRTHSKPHVATTRPRPAPAYMSHNMTVYMGGA